MNVLLFTSDTAVLREDSAARARIMEYASFTKRLVVVALNRRRDAYKPLKISESLWILPTNSWIPLLSPFTAARIARRELFFQGTLQADLIAADDPCGSAVAGILLRRFKKPLHIRIAENIFSPYFIAESLRTKARSLLARFTVGRAAAVIATSEAIRAELADINAAMADKTVVVPPYIDVEAFRKEPPRVNLAAKYPQFKFLLLVVAPLVASQNVQLAITALKSIVAQYKYAGLVIVGEGKQRRRLRAHARLAGLRDHVVFEDWNTNIHSYYKTCHVLLVPALYEEYGQTIAEAAACGAAIISTPIGIAPAIIENGISGFLCDASDAGCFTASVMAMIQDPHLRERVKMNVTLFLEKQVGAYADESKRAYKESWEKAARGRSAVLYG